MLLRTPLWAGRGARRNGRVEGLKALKASLLCARVAVESKWEPETRQRGRGGRSCDGVLDGV